MKANRDSAQDRWVRLLRGAILTGLLAASTAGRGSAAAGLPRPSLAGPPPAPSRQAATIIVTTVDDVFDADAIGVGGPCVPLAEGVPPAMDPSLLPGPDGFVSLREAICAANGDPADNLIVFSLPGSPPYTMGNDRGNLPGLVDDGTVIDGTIMPLYAGTPLVEISGPLGNAGLIIEGSGVVVRGLAITNFDYCGICVRNPTASGTIIEDNYIGVDPDGLTAEGNGPGVYGTGVQIVDGADSVVVRDNLISGNGYGIYTWTNDNLFEDNWIGSDSSGAVALGNTDHGIVIISPFGGSSSGNQVVGNILVGNTGAGIYVGDDAVDVVVQGNLIGVGGAGSTPLGNGRGLDLAYGAANVLVGGTAAGEPNVIASNLENGISLRVPDTTGNQIVGNFIGTNAAASLALGNGGDGIAIEYGAHDNTIEGNVVVASGGRGIRLRFLDPDGNSLTGNFIGETPSGSAMGNALAGVEIDAGSTDVSQNVIAHNGGEGVRLLSGSANSILGNAVYDNGALGINLVQPAEVWGVTPNDPGDGDSGPNALLNFPEWSSLTSALAEGTACDGCLVEVFLADPDPSTYGEGMTFLTSGTAAGGSFSIDLSGVALGTCDELTLTATDAAGNTSEFSPTLQPGAGGFSCLAFIPNGMILIGVILVGGVIGGGLGYRVKGGVPWLLGGVVAGGLAGALVFTIMRPTFERQARPSGPVVEIPDSAADLRTPTDTPLSVRAFPTTKPIPVEGTPTLTATATLPQQPVCTPVACAPGSVLTCPSGTCPGGCGYVCLEPTASRTPKPPTAAPDAAGPSIKSVSDSPDPIKVSQPKGCTPTTSTVSAAISDPSGVQSAYVLFFHTAIGQVAMTHGSGNTWSAVLGPYTGIGDGTVDYQIHATDGQGNASDSAFGQITVLACLK